MRNMKRSNFLLCCLGMQERTSVALRAGLNQHARLNSTLPGSDPALDTELLLQKFVNYEQQGVPDNAGTNGKKGFDLVRQAGSA